MANREIKKGEEKMENDNKIPGKGAATTSMVLGIISVVLWFFGYSALVSVILGIVGLILAGNAKKAGFVGGMQTAGFVLSLIGLIGGAIFPPIMGALADAMSAQLGAIIVMSVGCIYVLVIGVGYKAIIEGKKAAVKA